MIPVRSHEADPLADIVAVDGARFTGLRKYGPSGIGEQINELVGYPRSIGFPGDRDDHDDLLRLGLEEADRAPDLGVAERAR